MMSLISKYFSINPQAVASNYREWIRLFHGFLLMMSTISPLSGLYFVQGRVGPGLFIVILILVPISYLINKIMLNLSFGIIYVFLNIADHSGKTAKEVQYIRMKRFPSE